MPAMRAPPFNVCSGRFSPRRYSALPGSERQLLKACSDASPTVSLDYPAAGLLLFALGGGPLLSSPLLRRYAFLAYGIYLSQNIVLEPVRTMMNCLHVAWTTPMILAMFAVNLLITASISILLSRSRFTRWLLG